MDKEQIIATINHFLEEDFEVPKWHKELVIERINTATSQSFKSWDDVKNKLT